MMLVGRIYRDTGPFWVVEVPQIGVFTQGRSRAEAEEMLIDAVQEVVHCDGFAASVAKLEGDEILVSGSDPTALAAYVRKYQRETNGVSVADAVKKHDV